MYKRTVTYKDFKGNKRTEVLRFNLTEAEIAEMEISNQKVQIDGSAVGGLKEHIQDVFRRGSGAEIMAFFKDIIFKSYGILDDDGRRFRKSEEISREFSETGAYTVFFNEIMSNEKIAATFINNTLPNEKTMQTDLDKPSPDRRPGAGPEVTKMIEETMNDDPDTPILDEVPETPSIFDGLKDEGTEPSTVTPPAEPDDAAIEAYLARKAAEEVTE